jgi:hypothetical protein
MKRYAVLLLAMLVGLNTLAVAQAQTVERTIKAQAGRDTRINVFASIRQDCKSGPLPTIRLKVPPVHGKVTVKQAKLRTTNLQQCLAAEVPALVVIYRSTPDFFGSDLVVLEVINSNGKIQVQNIAISVGTAPDGRRI